MKRNLIYVLLFSIGILSSACKKATDIYLGIPLQPDIEENNYEEGLNIIGILRPDYIDTVNRSFVFVQEVAPALAEDPDFTIDSMNVYDATVIVTNENTGKKTQFVWTNSNNLFSQTRYRPQSDIKVTAGNTFDISCSSGDLPVLTSSTTIPNTPQIIDNTITITSDLVSFNVMYDSTIYLYEVYLYQNDQQIGFLRQTPDSASNTTCEIELNNGVPNYIEIYSYDYNLSSYITVSNTNLNFNKYRTSFGNVENGYGVFGSLNYSFINLE